MIHLFGATTPTGEALRNIAEQHISAYTSKNVKSNDWLQRVDLNNPESFLPVRSSDASDVLISFAPIWLLAPFLQQLELLHPERLKGLAGVIACSSSSVVTKRFAANHFDRKLVASLAEAEDKLLETCRELSLPCRVLRPTLIYGRVGNFCDSNLSLVLKQLRRFPVLPFPAETGLRQPIHARQLAEVTLHLANQLVEHGWDISLPERISLGGDSTLSYFAMISALQKAMPFSDPARRCRLFLIPNRIFFFLTFPLLLLSPKAFESVLRMAADLSGFVPASHLNESEDQPFPLQPLA